MLKFVFSWKHGCVCSVKCGEDSCTDRDQSFIGCICWHNPQTAFRYIHLSTVYPVKWYTGLARLSNPCKDCRTLIEERATGARVSPQAALKLLGRTLPLTTGLQGQPGLSGFVMNSTTGLGLLFPSELYAATWKSAWIQMIAILSG